MCWKTNEFQYFILLNMDDRASGCEFLRISEMYYCSLKYTCIYPQFTNIDTNKIEDKIKIWSKNDKLRKNGLFWKIPKRAKKKTYNGLVSTL